MSHLSAYQGVKWEGESFQSAGDTDSYLSCSTEHTEVHFPESEYGMDYVKANQLKLVWRITKNLLQSSCFRKIPDIFIGNTTGSSRDIDHSKSNLDCLLRLESRSEI